MTETPKRYTAEEMDEEAQIALNLGCSPKADTIRILRQAAASERLLMGLRSSLVELVKAGKAQGLSEATLAWTGVLEVLERDRA